MEGKPSLQILLVSGACCSPNLIRQDQLLEQALGQAFGDLQRTFEVRKVSLSHVLHGKENISEKQQKQILNLFQSYNTRFTPALFFNDDIRFAGKIPSNDVLRDALKDFIYEGGES